MNTENPIEAFRRLEDYLKRHVEYWKNTGDDPYDIAQGVMVALAEVRVCVSKCIRDMTPPDRRPLTLCEVFAEEDRKLLDKTLKVCKRRGMKRTKG